MLGNTIGKNMKKLRLERNLSQDIVAHELNIRRQTLSAYERGKNTPDIYILMEMSYLYDVTLDELTGNDKRREAREQAQKQRRPH